MSLFHFLCTKVAKGGEIGLPMLIVIVVFSQYLVHFVKPRKDIIDRFVLFSVVIVWIYAHVLTVEGAYNGEEE
ncbi:Nucleobase-ascorbate transporter 6 [Salvia divinorum]|uniref:Nucleobase-ascorbate transporter 6 n=1 Tax=Salvia divinorum TaxID=28513 RepID=A0ABD1GPY0_SALDI